MEIKRIISNYLDSNTFLVCEEGQCLIVDVGASIDEVKKGIGENKVVGILLTHGHFDHCAYIEEYQEEFNCPIYINKNGKKTMGDKELNYSKEVIFPTNKRFVFLDKDKKIKCGHFEINYYSTPGHSPCGSCFLIGDDLFAGDTIFAKGIGRIDLLESSEKGMLDSLDKINKLKFEHLHSGHGEDSSFEEQKRNLSAYIRFLSRK